MISFVCVWLSDKGDIKAEKRELIFVRSTDHYPNNGKMKGFVAVHIRYEWCLYVVYTGMMLINTEIRVLEKI